MKKLVTGLLIVLLVASCNGRYGSMRSTMSSCGHPQVSYTQFHDCMKGRVTTPAPGAKEDYYTVSTHQFLDEMQAYREKVERRALSSEKANEGIASFVDQKILEEQKSAQTAAAVSAVFLGGAALAACANNGGCGGGGGQSYANDNRGCCSWHGGIQHGMCAPNGNLMCNDGTPSPTCRC